MEDDIAETAAKSHAIALQEIWEKVADRIIEHMLELTREHIDVVHVNLRPEMILALAKLRLGIYTSVARIRQAGRDLADIEIAVEKAECFDFVGIERIEATARNFAVAWLGRYRERWKPKSLAALERESNPPKPKRRSPKPVAKNHYIGKAFIKRYWATNGRIRRWRKDSSGEFVARSPEPYGKWGYRKNLYSDNLEDYFGLVESDAAQPLDMLLAGHPLNHPQREALIGFFMIQLLRNPSFLERIEKGMEPLVESFVGTRESRDQSYMRAVRESLFGSNDFYNRIAGPVFWNTWVVVKSEAGFILPETWGVLRPESDTASVFCVPISPSYCFFSLSPREGQKRVLPIAISADPERAAQINQFLVTPSTREFISALSFGGHLEGHGAPGSPLEWLRAEVQRVNADVGDWI